MSDTIKIHFALTSSPSTPRIPLDINPTSTSSAELYKLAAEATRIPSSTLKLIFRGRIVKKESEDGGVAAAYKLEDGSVIHCMGKPTAPAAVVAVNESSASTTTSRAAGATVSAPTTTASSSTGSSSASTDLPSLLTNLSTSNPPASYSTALNTLLKILDNISKNPTEEKYRKLKTANAAFHKRFGGLNGSKAVLLKIGFEEQTVEDGNVVYVLVPSKEKWDNLVVCRGMVQSEASRVQRESVSGGGVLPFGAGAAAANPMAAGAGGFGGMGGMPSFGGAGAGGMPPIPPGMEGMVENMLSNPQALQAMLQNPMVQQAMERDPRLAANPQMRQSIQALANNPQMLQQMSQMMSDPNMREQMNNMMRSGAMPGMGGMPGVGGGAMPGAANNTPNANNMQQQMRMMQAMMAMQQGAGAAAGGAPAVPPAPTNTNSNNNNNAGGAGGDSEMTEEEMIAEAIARSLREN